MNLVPPEELADLRSELLAEGGLAIALASALVADAMALGVEEISLSLSAEPWVIVGATNNWIGDSEAQDELFQSFALWPKTSKYFRSEFRVLAGASAVFLWDEKRVRLLKGSSPSHEATELASQFAFAVGFLP